MLILLGLKETCARLEISPISEAARPLAYYVKRQVDGCSRIPRGQSWFADNRKQALRGERGRKMDSKEILELVKANKLAEAKTELDEAIRQINQKINDISIERNKLIDEIQDLELLEKFVEKSSKTGGIQRTSSANLRDELKQLNPNVKLGGKSDIAVVFKQAAEKFRR